MRAILVFAFATVLTAAAQAQSSFPPPKSKVFAGSVLRDALDKITGAECGKGRRCAPTTPEEKKNPPLDLSETDFVMRRAIVSGVAAQCGLDWENRNFRPMMNYMRTTLKKNERQLAIVGMIHKIIFEMPVYEPCDSKTRAETEKELTFEPPTPPTRFPIRAG